MRITEILNWGCAITIILLSVSLTASSLRADHPTPETLDAFDHYVKASEARGREELASKHNFLWIEALPERDREQNYETLKRGQTVIQRFKGCRLPGCAATPDGLIHDWIGIVFIPGGSLAQALAALQDYDHDSDYYRPQVVQSRLLTRSGDSFRIFLRLKQAHVVTVVFDTEYDIQYTLLDGTHAASESRSTRIAEVESAGSSQEHVKPPGDDRGFLWRLYSYWRFYEADGGVYVQCNAISLSRNVPTGLGWIVAPFIENIPRESLRFTLTATRRALLNKFHTASGVSKKSQEHESAKEGFEDSLVKEEKDEHTSNCGQAEDAR